MQGVALNDQNTTGQSGWQVSFELEVYSARGLMATENILLLGLALRFWSGGGTARQFTNSAGWGTFIHRPDDHG